MMELAMKTIIAESKMANQRAESGTMKTSQKACGLAGEYSGR